ncbi:hypothetical protein E1B28_012755 [Marasmius oreades]|uniref:Uncharacterized protein n=1 Tax=Marasmius oreades TaxID=181124 RepID=A0A9P7RT87_9AGAR|nr:uncharacterized protein E1B28_012755 [Marasmius oreades]KAG7088791.1 hypothetical protein E1B28_012755 [Marasmius oreades]
MSKDESQRLRRWQSSRIRILKSQSQNSSDSDFDSQWWYPSISSRKAIPLPIQQLQQLLKLKYNYRSQGGDKSSPKDIELNAELVGVKAAVGVLRPYELCVGIELPSATITNTTIRDISRKEDHEAVALNQKKWRELMEELSRPIDDVRKSGVDLTGKVAVEKSSTVDQNVSLLPGLDLASWGDCRTSLPSPLKPKLRPLVIFTTRGGGTRSCTLTPCVGDNDHAVSPSLSPSEIAAELSEMKRSPTPPLSLSFSSESTDSSPKSIAASPSSTSLPDFIFPSLSSPPIPRKIHLEKDAQGFFIGLEEDHSHQSADTSGLLPPFLIEETPRRKANQSRTRSIVDRLKRRASDEELSKPQSQPKVVDGWAGMGFWEPYRPDHSKAEKKRELFLAKKQQLEFEENNNHQKAKKKDSPSSASRSSRASISISNPNNSNEGWIEFKQPARHHTIRPRSQNNKRHSHSQGSISHPPQPPPPPQTAPAAYTTFRPPPLPPLPQLQPQLQPQPQPHPQHHQAYYYPYPYPHHQYAATTYPQVQPHPHPHPHPYATTYSMVPTVPITTAPVPGSVPGPLFPATTTVAKHPGYAGFMGRAPVIGYPGVW